MLPARSRDFEGIGSTLMTVAETVAEALHSNRVVVWGPPEAHPPIFSGSSWDRCVTQAAGKPLSGIRSLAI